MQSTIFKSLTIMLSFSAVISVSACSEEQQQAAKNTADTVVKETDKAIEATKKSSGEAWDATKDATQSAADTVADKTGEAVEATKEASNDAWDATKDATNSVADAVEDTTSETLDSAKQAIK